jgi:peptide/nickel transport system ATP-binding protein
MPLDAGSLPTPLLKVENLTISVGGVSLVKDIGFAIERGERVGMVGESGCGKSVTGLSLMRLLAPTISAEGRILLAGEDLLTLTQREMVDIRGRRIGMIFQEPTSALDPVFSIGAQIAETLRRHLGLGGRAARARAIELMDAVGIPAPAKRYDSYPHQFSGGMRQRAMIAIAIACEPGLLIADEPTTALDVTVQAQIIDLLIDLSSRMGTALLLITHDIGVVAEACTRVLTMYAGQLVEDVPVADLLSRPLHPYSSGLLRSLPRLSPRKGRLPSIPGRVPTPDSMPNGCRFAPRCTHSDAGCAEPQLVTWLQRRAVRCHRHGQLNLPGAGP